MSGMETAARSRQVEQVKILEEAGGEVTQVSGVLIGYPQMQEINSLE